MTRTAFPVVFWLPRILAAAFIVFLVLFSLDVISPELTLTELAVGLLIHNIPALVLLLVLIISWKHEIVGGVAFLLAGLLYLAISARKPVTGPLIISWLAIAGPAFLIGALFLVNWYKKK